MAIKGDYFKVLYSKADKDIVIDDLVYKCEQCRVLYDSAEKSSIENYNLQERIDKALELLNKSQFELDNIPCNYENDIEKLRNILRGDE